jgi:hypothetical protein
VAGAARPYLPFDSDIATSNVAAGLMSLDVQKRLFALALDRLGDEEPINELVELTLAEDRSIRIAFYDLPARK